MSLSWWRWLSSSSAIASAMRGSTAPTASRAARYATPSWETDTSCSSGELVVDCPGARHRPTLRRRAAPRWFSTQAPVTTRPKRNAAGLTPRRRPSDSLEGTICNAAVWERVVPRGEPERRAQPQTSGRRRLSQSPGAAAGDLVYLRPGTKEGVRGRAPDRDGDVPVHRSRELDAPLGGGSRGDAGGAGPPRCHPVRLRRGPRSHERRVAREQSPQAHRPSG